MKYYAYAIFQYIMAVTGKYIKFVCRVIRITYRVLYQDTKPKSALIQYLRTEVYISNLIPSLGIRTRPSYSSFVFLPCSPSARFALENLSRWFVPSKSTCSSKVQANSEHVSFSYLLHLFRLAGSPKSLRIPLIEWENGMHGLQPLPSGPLLSSSLLFTLPPLYLSPDSRE